ncbi:tyrosine-type recombinase/integrase [Bacteriovorax sp. Seq25_V]|uniref:tyrosine-type recombinase/integrase n=1 Tax=Bacteriovorax sp. Seq25_V TaxID=1201288 RepID=UPI00038A3F15|nr:tyrosine-type recombinase/integrase [Bacteriovorax sp. Seq25_V]EQC44294.1 site-specific recombinase, phage integrase family [Bacteriovorax sp. Seq25_V]
MEQFKTRPNEHRFLLDDEFFENFTSAHTRKNYLIDINQFLKWVNDFFDLSDYKDIQRIHVIKYRNYLSEIGGHGGEPCTPKTINRKLASLSTYFKYLVERNYCQINPVSSVKRPRPEVKSPTNAISKAQVLEIFDAISRNKNSGPMHMALLVTFFTTGLRKSEILNLRFKDYHRHGDHMVFEYRGKGGKLGKKLLNPVCVKAINEYVKWMEELERPHEESDWLFQPTRNPSDPKNLNKPLNPKTINEIINSYAKKVGIGVSVTPHSARATFISELLGAGVDIYTVAREVNHASVKTTQEYDKRRKKLIESPVNILDWE